MSWLVRLPGRAEARWLAGEDGPFRADPWGQRLPGTVDVLDKGPGEVWVRLDQASFDSLAHLGTVSHADGRITFADGPLLHVGGGVFPLMPE